MSLVVTEGNSPLLTKVKSLSWSCDLFKPEALQCVPGRKNKHIKTLILCVSSLYYNNNLVHTLLSP